MQEVECGMEVIYLLLIWLICSRNIETERGKPLIWSCRKSLGTRLLFGWCFRVSTLCLGGLELTLRLTCACRKRWLIMGYKLSYTTGLLYAWSSCMQRGEWVWAVRHWVVLVQVKYCSKGGWVLYLKNQRLPRKEILSYSHSHKPNLPVITPLSLVHVLAYSSFLPPPLKPHCQCRVMGFVGAAVTLPSQLPYPHHLLCTIL